MKISFVFRNVPHQNDVILREIPLLSTIISLQFSIYRSDLRNYIFKDVELFHSPSKVLQHSNHDFYNVYIVVENLMHSMFRLFAPVTCI